MHTPTEVRLTVAVCTFNRADHLGDLVVAIRKQRCPVPFEILVVDNNSTDDTQRVLKELRGGEGARLRVVEEVRQGITYARNRAIEESRESDYLAFIDDDELPGPNWLKAAVDALEREGAEAVGGEIRVRLPSGARPKWLTDELLGFLGQSNHGPTPFWISDRSTPIWSGNVAYRTELFSDELRFDHRYNRAGLGIGGGEDAIMLRKLLEQRRKLRYRPDMVIDHLVESWKLRRGYFLKLHFGAGQRFGQFETADYERNLLGVPPFMLGQAARQWGEAVCMFLKGDPGALRQGMNAAHATGAVKGRLLRVDRVG